MVKTTDSVSEVSMPAVPCSSRLLGKADWQTISTEKQITRYYGGLELNRQLKCSKLKELPAYLLHSVALPLIRPDLVVHIFGN